MKASLYKSECWNRSEEMMTSALSAAGDCFTTRRHPLGMFLESGLSAPSDYLNLVGNI